MALTKAQRVQARKNLRAATSEMTPRAIATLTLKQLRSMVNVPGCSIAFIRNLRHAVVRRRRRQILQAIANGLVAQMSGTFPSVAVVPGRGRTLKVFLNGLPPSPEEVG